MDTTRQRPRPPSYALSLKQPWAALLVHGYKTIEVRKWRPTRYGRILIHAARVPDERPEVWQRVPAELSEIVRLRGGILGVGELTDYKVYRNSRDFAADQARHLNDPSWFEPPCLFGFVFRNLTPLPFRPCPGWMRFFEVPEEEHPSADTGAGS